MKRMFSLLFYVVFISGCTSYGGKHIDTKDWNKATREVIDQYGPHANQTLKAEFKDAGLPFPPAKIELLVFKKERKVELWAKGHVSSWRYIKTYPMHAFSGGPGPKLREFDRQIPEGIYRIVELNPFSALQLSLKLDYPNAFDRSHAKAEGRKKLGGNIFIHGAELSVGCIAIGDANINELFVLVGETGMRNVEVVSVPNDLRYEAPAGNNKANLKWLPSLYAKLKNKLRNFKHG